MLHCSLACRKIEIPAFGAAHFTGTPQFRLIYASDCIFYRSLRCIPKPLRSVVPSIKSRFEGPTNRRRLTPFGTWLLTLTLWRR